MAREIVSPKMAREIVSPKLDVIFKKIFTENEDMLHSFAAGMLGKH